MQEAAGNHAAKLGVSVERLHAEGLAWVLARMRIVPVSLPSAHERIRVETWPVGVEGVQFRRDFIVRGEDDTVLARAVSHWVVVSLDTRKVGRIPAFIAELALDNAMKAMDDGKSRLAEVGGDHEACSFRARLADVDRNRHVNNVRYLEWVLESVPDDARGRMRLADLEIVFRAESFWNDVVASRIMPEERGDAFAHSLVRKADGRELVRARTLWVTP
jgi:acyl-ACP thioesterase